jgi:hypothetical protein
MVYKQSEKRQNWLFLPSIKDMISKYHICFLVEDFVEGLDYKKFDMIYAGHGNPIYHPRILMKILVQGTLFFWLGFIFRRVNRRYTPRAGFEPAYPEGNKLTGPLNKLIKSLFQAYAQFLTDLRSTRLCHRGIIA